MDGIIEEIISREINKRGNYKELSIVRINFGNSTAINYYIKTSKIQMFAKLYRGTNDIRFQAIRYICDKGVNLIKPLYDFQVNKEIRCMVMEWISGENVSKDFASAERIACILKELHNVQVPSEMPQGDIREELEYYKEFIKNNAINFMCKDKILDYLHKNASLCRDVYAFAHMDVHIKNFIQHEDKIFLVDYENVSITDPWRDFVYAVFFHDSIEDDFWVMVINKYFENQIPENFWCITKYYCYIHLLRMIICEYKKDDKTKIEEIARSVCRGFPLDANKPKWFTKYKG